jgi:hypothetical protein
MDRKKISTTVYITQDQNQTLKLLNQKTKVPIAEYIREGIDLVLEKYKQHLPGQLSFLGEESAGLDGSGQGHALPTPLDN